jgi:hypothetical protein
MGAGRDAARASLTAWEKKLIQRQIIGRRIRDLEEPLQSEAYALVRNELHRISALPAPPSDLLGRWSSLARELAQPPPALTPGLLQQALSGGPSARGQLAEAMVSIIQMRVSRLLLRAGAVRERDGRQELEDIVQAVLLALFDKDCHSLRQWRPEGGLSFENWVGMLAEREVISSLRNRPRNPWTDEPTDDEEEIEPPSSTQNPRTTAPPRNMPA